MKPRFGDQGLGKVQFRAGHFHPAPGSFQFLLQFLDFQGRCLCHLKGSPGFGLLAPGRLDGLLSRSLLDQIVLFPSPFILGLGYFKSRLRGIPLPLRYRLIGEETLGPFPLESHLLEFAACPIHFRPCLLDLLTARSGEEFSETCLGRGEICLGLGDNAPAVSLLVFDSDEELLSSAFFRSERGFGFVPAVSEFPIIEARDQFALFDRTPFVEPQFLDHSRDLEGTIHFGELNGARNPDVAFLRDFLVFDEVKDEASRHQENERKQGDSLFHGAPRQRPKALFMSIPSLRIPLCPMEKNPDEFPDYRLIGHLYHLFP